jgi:hypothetical protein
MNIRSTITILSAFIVLSSATGCAAEAVGRPDDPTGTAEMGPAGASQGAAQNPDEAPVTQDPRDTGPATVGQSTHPIQTPAWNPRPDHVPPKPRPGVPVEAIESMMRAE